MTGTLHVHFAHDQLVYRYVFRPRPRTRRQQRLAARRTGTAHSFKREWKESWAPGICLPIGYEAFARARRQHLLSLERRQEVLTQPFVDLYNRIPSLSPTG